MIRLEGLQIVIDRRHWMNQLGIPVDGLILLSVGELNENKNHAIVIEALAQLKDSRIHYCIAGTGILEKELRAKAKSAGVNLHLLGFSNEVAELMRMSDLYLLPSHREGLNVSLMEAMSSGMPCVCSDIRGNRDLIDARGGFLCKPIDADAFSFGIMELENAALRIDMGTYNRHVIKSFDVNSIMKMMSKVYVGEDLD